jgi:hypothetical protein
VGKARGYLAGLGAAGAIVGAAIVAFLTVAALVAFDGGRGSSGHAPEESVSVGSSGAPRGSLTALSTPGRGDGRSRGADGPAAGSGSEAGVSPGGGTATEGTGEAAPGVSAPPAPSAPAQPAGGDAAGTSPPASGTGPVGSVVDEVDGVAGGLGLDPSLGDTTEPITEPVDQALQDTLPGVTGGN